MALTAQGVNNVIHRYLEKLHRHRDDLNRLNVYPVPDGDTGTNMALTVQSVVDGISDVRSMPELAKAIAHASLMGALGNSGIILAQILRGLSDVMSDHEALGIEQLVEALARATDASYKALGNPVDGTILTVLRDSAEAAQETATSSGGDLAHFLQAVYARAEQSLERTPDLLPVLKEAGVVDAGAAGFLLLLAAFLEEVTGNDVPLPLRLLEAAVQPVASTTSGVSSSRYEVMFFLESTGEEVERLKQSWRDVGDSILIVGGDETYSCHIHTDDIAGALEAGIEAGKPFQIRVTDLLENAGDHEVHGPEPSILAPVFADAPVGVVSVAAGSGLVELYHNLGAQGVVVGGQSMNPSLADLLEQIEAVPAKSVVLLPNNQNIIPVADQADGASDKEVFVVPTQNAAQGLAAMIAYLPNEDDPTLVVSAMTAAVESIRSGELTRAVRSADTPIGPVAEGDWLGLVDGTVAVVAARGETAIAELLSLIVDDETELVTLIVGEDAVEAVTEACEMWLRDKQPDVALELVDGGQPTYPYLVIVE